MTYRVYSLPKLSNRLIRLNHLQNSYLRRLFTPGPLHFKVLLEQTRKILLLREAQSLKIDVF